MERAKSNIYRTMLSFWVLLLMTACSIKGQEYSNQELYQMIHQLQNTVHNLLNNTQKDSHIGFYAQLSTDKSNLGDARAIEFDKVITNEGNSYDRYHGHFTAPVNGMYLLSASVMAVPYHALSCEIVKNGVTFAYLYGGAGNYIANTHTSVIMLNAGDMVWVRHRAGMPDDRIHALYSYFSGFLIKHS